MLQKPNTVLVGSKAYAGLVADGLPSAVNALAVGDVVIINPATGGAIPATELIAAATFNEIQLGVVRAIGVTNADATIVKTNAINRNKVNSVVGSAYAAKTEASVAMDFTGATITAGIRYVLRVIYKDIYEHPGQFTHTYEVVAATGETIATICAKFVALVAAHSGARCTASYNAGTEVLTFTAKVIDGPGTAGKEAITPYSQVQMTVAAYKTNPAAAFSKKEGFLVLDMVVVAGKPGKGNPYIVRDREQAALGYKGITYRTEWPVIKPELTVDLSASYGTAVVEFGKEYQSPDNQYVKSTDLAVEVYINIGGAGAGDAEAIAAGIALWAGK